MQPVKHKERFWLKCRCIELTHLLHRQILNLAIDAMHQKGMELQWISPPSAVWDSGQVEEGKWPLRCILAGRNYCLKLRLWTWQALSFHKASFSHQSAGSEPLTGCRWFASHFTLSHTLTHAHKPSENGTRRQSSAFGDNQARNVTSRSTHLVPLLHEDARLHKTHKHKCVSSIRYRSLTCLKVARNVFPQTESREGVSNDGKKMDEKYWSSENKKFNKIMHITNTHTKQETRIHSCLNGRAAFTSGVNWALTVRGVSLNDHWGRSVSTCLNVSDVPVCQ